MIKRTEDTEVIVISPVLKWIGGIISAIVVSVILSIAVHISTMSEDMAVIKSQLQTGYVTKEQFHELKDRVTIIESSKK